MECNELSSRGIDFIAHGLSKAHHLQSLNIKGNGIRDEGLDMIAEALLNCPSLEELDISVNEISPIGISSLADVLPRSNVKILIMNKNILGDESLIFIADKLCAFEQTKLICLDVSSSRIGDKGIIYFWEKT